MNVWNTFLISAKIQSTIQINTVLSLLEKLPFFPKRINCANYKLKNKLVFLSVLLEIIGRLIVAVIFVGLGFILPFSLLRSKFPAYAAEPMDVFYKLFLCLFLGMGSITNNSFSNPKEQRFLCIKRFYLDPKSYYFFDFVMTHFWNLIGSLPVYIFVMLKYNVFTWWIILLIPVKEIFGVVGDYCHIRFCEIMKCSYRISMAVDVLFKLLFILLCFGLICLKSVSVTDTVLTVTVVLSLLLSLYAGRKLYGYSNFMKVFLAIDKADDISTNLPETEPAAAIRNVKEHAEDAADVEEEPFIWLSGLFTERLLRSYTKRFRLIWLAVISAAAAFVCLGLLDAEKAAVYGRFAVEYCWIPAVLCFGISGNRKMIRLMFFECDSALLHYRFYREKDAVRQTYFSRLMFMTGMNLKNAFPVAAAMLFVSVYVKASVLSIICAVLPVFLLSVLAAVHYVFVYYYLQPFSTETTMLKPSFSIEEWAMNLLIMTVSVIQNHILPVAALIVAAYTAVSVFLVYKNGERRFKLW